jgi:ribosomal-protein-alanine N-acetyltransferase
VNEIIIRPAGVADLNEVVAMERRCYGDPWAASSFTTLPENPQVYFAVARQGSSGTLAGYVIGWYVLDEGELANLAVAPELRRTGVGRRLLDAMLDDAASRGVTAIYLECRESNSAARRLYSGNGFVEVSRRKQYYRKPREDALFLRRTLAQHTQDSSAHASKDVATQ